MWKGNANHFLPKFRIKFVKYVSRLEPSEARCSIRRADRHKADAVDASQLQAGNERAASLGWWRQSRSLCTRARKRLLKLSITFSFFLFENDIEKFQIFSSDRLGFFYL